jgi:hypothetical protein
LDRPRPVPDPGDHGKVLGDPLLEPTQCTWYPHDGDCCWTCTVASKPFALNCPVLAMLLFDADDASVCGEMPGPIDGAGKMFPA